MRSAAVLIAVEFCLSAGRSGLVCKAVPVGDGEPAEVESVGLGHPFGDFLCAIGVNGWFSANPAQDGGLAITTASYLWARHLRRSVQADCDRA